MNYSVDFFIKKFEAIPEEKIIDGTFELHGRDGYHCAAGHCGSRLNFVPTPEAIALATLLKSLNISFTTSGYEGCINKEEAIIWNFISRINDGQAKQYQQDTPKQRILAALYDILKMQDDTILGVAEDKIEPTFDPIIDKPVYPDNKPKEKIRYVSVPEHIKEMEVVEN